MLIANDKYELHCHNITSPNLSIGPAKESICNMLVRVVKPNFDALHEATKQLLIWTFNRKQDFHSTLQNDYYSRERNQRRLNFRDKKWDLNREGIDRRKEFNSEELTPIEKNFYTPHPDVVNRSESEVKSFHDKHDIRLFGNSNGNCPTPIFSFSELDLPSETVSVIRDLKYSTPTPIQSQTWPIALSGLNMVGIGQTGSGKTLGFVLPGLIHIKNQPPLQRREGPMALVISPTRELAQQTDKVFSPFAKSYLFRTACVFGGISKETQYRQLLGAHICVGTPGRIIDFLRSDVINLSRCTYIVLDEADRLLDMGFEPQINAIMKNARPDSQVLMWSATWPKDVQDLAMDHLKDYVGVKFGSSELSVNTNIVQHIHVCEKYEKRGLLFKLLEEITENKDNKTLVFAQTKFAVTQIYHMLRERGYSVIDLHGDKSQSQRDRALSLFRRGSTQILVGTGVVGRGLDITDIKYVINYDFPNLIEDYVHIIGRTGRSNTEGTAHSFFTQDDARFAKELIKILQQSNQEINPELMNLVVERPNFHSNRFSRNFKSRQYR